MRAAVARGSRIAVENWPDPAPAVGQVVIAPHATGICGSDLHFRELLVAGEAADPSAPQVPFVFGHEFAGEVVAIGPDTDTPLAVGDLVTANPFTTGPMGTEIVGLSPTSAGALAEFTVAGADRCFRLPEGLDGRLGALAEPLAVAVHAMARAAATGPIVVVGTGPIGLGIIAVAATTGRGPIVAVDPAPARRAAASGFGADVAVEPGTPLGELLAGVGWAPSLGSALIEHDPHQVTIFECVGRPEVVASILAEAPTHAQVVLAGACMHPVEFSPVALTMAEVSISTSLAYRPGELRRAAEMVRDHPSRFGRMITSERPLEDTAAAFEALAHEPDQIKILIRPR